MSFDDAEAARNVLMYPWRTWIGTAILLARIPHPLQQRVMVDLYPALVALEPLGGDATLARPVHSRPFDDPRQSQHGIAEEMFDVTTYYNTVFIVQWVMFPWLGAVQILAVITVWTHACIGIHYWLRTKRWYPSWRPLFFGFGLLLPSLGAGRLCHRRQSGPARSQGRSRFRKFVARQFQSTDQTAAQVERVVHIGWAICLALTLLPFAGRGIRNWQYRRRKPPMLTHASGRSMPILPGATVLETLRAHGIAHASVCGGRARCTTCRVLVTKGRDRLAEPSALEAKALSRIGATAGTRLACQIRPTADLAVMPLLAADANAADGAVRGGLEGSERLITIVFVDMRGSTTLGEAKLPYDVLFILNQFFHEMTKALSDTHGHYSQFTGDGLMALYGLYADPATGASDAVRGAREMLARLDQLNHRLGGDLREPLRIGIGIHHNEAIVGAMGPPHSQIITAIGDTVNTCARLESLTKDYGCAVIISRQAAEAAGLRFVGHELHEAPVKGRHQPVQFYALKTLAELAI